MVKIFLLIILAWLIYKMSKGLLNFFVKDTRQANTPEIQKMVKCHKCGTYIPVSESMQFHQHYVCKQQPCQK